MSVCMSFGGKGEVYMAPWTFFYSSLEMEKRYRHFYEVFPLDAFWFSANFAKCQRIHRTQYVACWSYHELRLRQNSNLSLFAIISYRRRISLIYKYWENVCDSIVFADVNGYSWGVCKKFIELYFHVKSLYIVCIHNISILICYSTHFYHFLAKW